MTVHAVMTVAHTYLLRPSYLRRDSGPKTPPATDRQLTQLRYRLWALSGESSLALISIGVGSTPADVDCVASAPFIAIAPSLTLKSAPICWPSSASRQSSAFSLFPSLSVSSVNANNVYSYQSAVVLVRGAAGGGAEPLASLVSPYLIV